MHWCRVLHISTEAATNVHFVVTTNVHFVALKTARQQNTCKGLMLVLLYLRSHTEATILVRVTKLLTLHYKQHLLFLLTIPESNYLSVSRCQINGLGIAHNLDHSEKYLSDIGLFRDLHHSDSDRTDSFSTNSSTTSSSIGGEFARSSGARPDFSIFTKRHPQTKANTPQKDDKDE